MAQFFYQVLIMSFRTTKPIHQFIKITNLVRTLVMCVFFLLLNGCSNTLDLFHVYVDLDNIRQSIERSGNPVNNEIRLQNAVKLCTKEEDKACLSAAHQYYGHLYRSQRVIAEQDYYLKNGFLEPNVTYENKFHYSAKHFEKAINFLDSTKDYETIALLYIQLSLSYYLIADAAKECDALDKSLVFHLKAYPNDDISVEKVPLSFERLSDYIAHQKQRAGCEKLITQD
ncbi:hypothetical protein N473_24870 [Pseudoalteromonas luteoviolacea CPMOR-1]|uniref:Outer membrane lipoprotein BamD-like domain-containing protein n=2 Tax=Pseudoalteromonas luteoviolacea TaxID=43657 RepID=A0A167IXU8_9GAMM|nr:hypothetical protein N473_24870 [Pseudoalteromonas luteoviolacea CPMOR-1]